MSARYTHLSKNVKSNGMDISVFVMKSTPMFQRQSGVHSKKDSVYIIPI